MPLLAESENMIIHAVAGAQPLPDELVRLPAPEARKPEQEYRWRDLLTQRVRRFCLFNGHYLQLEDSARRRNREMVFNLAFLDPLPVHQVRRPYAWMAAGLLVAGAGLTALFFQWLAPGAALLALGMLFWLRFARGCRNRMVFISRLGRVPLFAVETGGLSGSQGRRFVALLSERIEGATAILPGGRQRMAVEVAEHRRLQQAGSLSAALYQRAKQRIFASFR